MMNIRFPDFLHDFFFVENQKNCQISPENPKISINFDLFKLK